jgi:uncharacterized phiE125 gp8 family phage protein
MSTIRSTFTIDGSLADIDSIVLSDPTGTYGVKRNDNDAVVVADGTAVTNIATGIYEHTFTDPERNLEYTYWIEWVYDGATMHNEYVVDGPAWPADAVGVPVTLSEAKLHLKVDDTDDDDLIEQLLSAATTFCEKFQNRTYLNRTRYLYLDAFPDEMILVPNPPLVSVTSIVYVDTDGTDQTWASSNYEVDNTSEPGRITPAYNVSWPSARSVTNAVTVEYIAGYGAGTADTPDDVKNAIKLLVAHWYDHREAVSDVQMIEAPLGVKSLLWSSRVLE